MWDILRRIKKAAILVGRPANRLALLQYGVAASIEHDVLLKCETFDVVVDVGSNKGQFSLATRHFQPRARIFGFEPQQRAANLYRKIFAGDESASLHQCAVGTDRRKAPIQLSGHDDSSSLLTISELQARTFPGTQAVGTEEVEVAPLTDFIDIDDLSGKALLKMDVQGYELEVLKSAEPLLSAFDVIYAEASFVPFYEGQVLAAELISYLYQHGFGLSGFANPCYDTKTGQALQADFLFKKNV